MANEAERTPASTGSLAVEPGTSRQPAALAELQSTNAGLQSSNGERQTAKEEMRSLNEELRTIGAELRSKIAALITSQ